METAESVYQDILAELIISGAQQPVKAFDATVAIRYMNRWMAQQDAEGVNLGYTIVSNKDDPITIPLGAINALIYNVALQLATRYDIQVDAVLAVKAQQAYKAMLNAAIEIQPSSYPDTLPIGSGNEHDNYRSDKFYSEQPDAIEAEIGGVIGLEDGTLNE